MDKFVEYFQQFPFFFWALVILVAAIAVLGILQLVRYYSNRRKKGFGLDDSRDAAQRPPQSDK